MGRKSGNGLKNACKILRYSTPPITEPLKCCNPSENDQHFALIFFAWGLKKE